MVTLLAGILKKRYCLATALALIIAFTLWHPVLADGPGDSPTQDGGRQVMLVSTTAECLVVQAGIPDSVSATVRLEWEGQIEKAFLVLSAAGSEGGHSIYVNGQRVGSAPVRPGGQLCQAGNAFPDWGSTDSISIPAEVLIRGENVITLTNDANVNDGWTAANLHIEIHGVLSGPPVALLEVTPPASPIPGVGAMAILTDTVLLTSSYDPPHQQAVSYQIPDGYTGDPTPLLVGIHGMGGTGVTTIERLGPMADSRGWLLVAPEMHGYYDVSDGSQALAWVGAQHDVIDAIEYMMDNYNVDRTRIYIVGGSMGGQTTLVMMAKYPDVFAAAAEWMGYTDLAIWYDELSGFLSGWPSTTPKKIRQEISGTDGSDLYIGSPSDSNPDFQFEYERRSPIEIPMNSRLVPFRMWHGIGDTAVISTSHAIPMQAAINNSNPITPAVLNLVDKCKNPSPPPDNDPTLNFGHCYYPTDFPEDGEEMFDHLYSYTLNSQPPLPLTIRTDESKPYYWLNFAQTGGDHWSEVEATYSLASKTVTATISDTQPLTLAFNLGSTPIVGRVMERSGMGLPATTYLIRGGGIYILTNYTSGYLTTTLSSTGQFTLTISAIEAEVWANPSIIPAGQIVTSTITAVVRDQLNNPVPDGTTVEFSTTAGTFPNASSTYPTTVTGGQGQATAILTTDGPAQIMVTIESVAGSTSVSVGMHQIYLPVVVKND